MADGLAVWLYGDHVASIGRDRCGPRLTYTDTALERIRSVRRSSRSPFPSPRAPTPRGRCDRSSTACSPRRGQGAVAREVGESPSDTYGLSGPRAGTARAPS